MTLNRTLATVFFPKEITFDVFVILSFLVRNKVCELQHVRAKCQGQDKQHNYLAFDCHPATLVIFNGNMTKNLFFENGAKLVHDFL